MNIGGIRVLAALTQAITVKFDDLALTLLTTDRSPLSAYTFTGLCSMLNPFYRSSRFVPDAQTSYLLR
ncbi:hypothetical protein DPMN_148704 [Dreissena polymorpha]|uniref:Uncharacterized protein n=1 Tax=Dreissena polymorpha TaxID=45954 RepID=A0A9D4J4M1_DREPO|nr:hypothetical protein DPMN_148704 [Dreissena polymorpha]